MLSTHSFNALLKTLEEPPPHVKFLLATTDPQKLPATILSRCLQFNLKNLSPERIVEHLQHVLKEEQVPCEEAGLWALARAADGSMRDALSLTDQAIAHGDGKLTEAEVSTMLGTIDLTAIADIARALVNNDGTEVLAVVQKMSEHAPDYNAALADLLSVWHRVAIAQTVPDALDNRHGDYQLIQELSKALSKEDVQLFYQTVLLGRRDLPLAPDPKTGFEMVMLRMLAFQPARENRIDPPVAPPEAKIASGDVPIPAVEEGVFDPLKKPEPAMPEVAAMVGADIQESTTKDDVQYGTQGSTQDSTQEKGLTVSTVDTSEYEPSEYEEFAALTETRRDKLNISVPEDVSVGPGIQLPVQEPAVDVLHQSDEPLTAQDIQVLSQEIHQHEVHQSEIPQQETLQQETPQEDGLAPTCSFNELIPEKWIEIYQGLSVGGVLQNVAANLALVEVRGNILRFDLDIANSSLYEEGHQQRLADTLSEYFGQPVGVDIEVGAVAMETPQANRLRKREERQAAALDSLKHDPNVRRVMDVFGGVLLEKTVKPID
jgi:DNA polymerase-3 subunit gamma/tau